MRIQQRISTFVQLGKILKAAGEQARWTGYDLGIAEAEYDALNENVIRAKVNNPWFTEENTRRAFRALAYMLEEEKLTEWTQAQDLEYEPNKLIGIIMAGNIPLVGFHDLLTVLISGNRALVKASSDDNILPLQIVQLLNLLNPEMAGRVQFAGPKMKGFDAVIATGSNNSARYFAQYFGDVPHIIRKNRNSIAVLTGEETEEELRAMGEDVFNYFGLGCRSITKLMLPEGYKIDSVFEALYDHNDVINHHKYANNYDYNKAVWLLNKEDLLDNGFLLMKQDEGICSPTGSLYYEFYSSDEQLNQRIVSASEEIQCVVGRNYIPFGKGQFPELWDYADGVDTLQWLIDLK